MHAMKRIPPMTKQAMTRADFHTVEEPQFKARRRRIPAATNRAAPVQSTRSNFSANVAFTGSDVFGKFRGGRPPFALPLNKKYERSIESVAHGKLKVVSKLPRETDSVKRT
jgi:hypothetical protein